MDLPANEIVFIQAMLNDSDFKPLPSENQSIYALIYEGFKKAIQAHEHDTIN